MKTKKYFDFNEKIRAELLLQSGFEERGYINTPETFMVLKYLRVVLGYGKIRLEREMIRLCKEQDSLFNPIVKDEFIRKIINSVMKMKALRTPKSLPLTQSEIDFLFSVPLVSTRQTLFLLLIVGKQRAIEHKLNRATIGSEELEKIIATMENIFETDIYSLERTLKALHKYNPEFIHMQKPNLRYGTNNRVYLNYVDLTGDKVSVINTGKIKDEYKRIFGNEHTAVCEICETTFVYKSKKPAKYCPDCRKDVDREKRKERHSKSKKTK